MVSSVQEATTKDDRTPGIDFNGVRQYFAEHLTACGAVKEIVLLSGGRSNLTYRVVTANGEVVLRRPPLGNILPSANDMAREFRVLAALANTNVPAPRALALCQDSGVTGAPFYVMQLVRGPIIGESVPEGVIDTPDKRRQLSLAVVDALSRLHLVDYDAVGLGSFGRPAGYLRRQVKRWSEQWERSKTRDVPEITQLIQLLDEHCPSESNSSIVHGDYRLGNLVLSVGEPLEVAAILDWEMATLGDPLSDLGWLLSFWGEPGDTSEILNLNDVMRFTVADGFLDRAGLVDEYARLTGFDAGEAGFYEILAYFKRAVIQEGIHARHLAGNTVGEGFDRFAGADKTARVALKLAARFW